MKMRYVREYQMMKKKLIERHTDFGSISFEDYDIVSEALDALILWWQSNEESPEDISAKDFLKLPPDMQKILLSCLKLPDEYRTHPYHKGNKHFNPNTNENND